MCGCASAHIAPTQESKFKPSNNETLLMLGLRKLAQQVGMCRHRASDGDTERMFHVPVPGTVQQQQPEHVSSRLSPDAPCRRACGARARAQGVQARGSARGRGRKARGTPGRSPPRLPGLPRSGRRVPPERSGHSTVTLQPQSAGAAAHASGAGPRARPPPAHPSNGCRPRRRRCRLAPSTRLVRVRAEIRARLRVRVGVNEGQG